ncbi:hypothetical protein HY933_00445 [Candidatus Falkowbacteria bacterium]|nr:hypothetical protein [Candidatus Falkowbacteria bacterium]
MDDRARPKLRLTREQKTGFALLFIFALVTVGLGLFQIRNTIYSPFAPKPAAEAATPLVLDEKTKLQQIDTDHDGLNDYEELEFYKTSPYLADTDSDGIKDKVEIDSGSDPLCPTGQTCSAAEADGRRVASTTPGLLGDFQSPLDALLPGQSFGAADLATTSTAAAVAPQPPALTPEQMQSITRDPKLLRELLLRTGRVNKADLDKIDDATLLLMANGLAPAPASPASASPQLDGSSSTT